MTSPTHPKSSDLLVMIADLQRQIGTLEAEVKKLRDNESVLRETIRCLRSQQFGSRRERYTRETEGQLSLFDLLSEEEKTKLANKSAEKEASESRRTEIKAHTRTLSGKEEKVTRRIPENLREVEIKAEVEAPLCPCCGETMKCIGHNQVSRTLSVIPAEYFWKVHVVPTFSCKECPSKIVRAKATKPSDGIRVDERFMSTLVVMKVLFGVPIYRFSKLLVARDIHFKYETLLSYCLKVAEIIDLIYEALGFAVMGSSLLHADESRLLVKMYDKKGGKDKVKTTFVWPFLAIDIGIYYIWSKSRSIATLNDILKEWQGTLVADGLSVYENVANVRNFSLVNCNAHCRRMFYRGIDGNDHAHVQKALKYYHVLYRVEESYKRRKERALRTNAAPPDLLALRQRFSKPILAALKQWLIERAQDRNILPKGALKKAIRYALKRWDSLTRFLDDASLPIDNNALERMIRTFAIGRKNFLFASSEVGAEAMAKLYSILQTCRMHGVDPELYLSDVLVRIHTTPKEQIADLLPHNWAVKFQRDALARQADLIARVQQAPIKLLPDNG